MTTMAQMNIEMKIGDSTQTHPQAMYPVSLSTIKAIVRRPTNPIPPEDEDEDEDGCLEKFIYTPKIIAVGMTLSRTMTALAIRQ